MTITIGLIGAGKIGRIHGESIAHRNPDGKLVAVCDIVQDVAQSLADALPSGMLEEMLTMLPLEIILADSEDTVKYFNKEESPKTLLKVKIGKKLQDCYPQKNLGIVNRMLSDFKAGKGDSTEFQIDIEGKRIHVRYLAVRDVDRKYMGCIQVNQSQT